ncbi:MAG: SLBB domain-containing protein [Ignavibacteriae bacterium]|nr:SLBB domain-containing protein [Ignavibacteriota bacterium]
MLRKFLIIFFNLFFVLLFSNTFAQTKNNDNSTSQMQALYLINVTIGGDFPLSGSYSASRTERVDQLITRISLQYKAEILGSTPDEKLLSLIRKNSDNFSKRNIILKRFNGEQINLDLVKFRLTGDFSHNPYLMNDDVIIFPPFDIEKNFVFITGAVNREIRFEFVEGEKLSDAIFIAQGLNPAFSNVDSAHISRLSSNGEVETLLKIKISDNPLLQRGDRINILGDAYQKDNYNVVVLGEVKRPGKIFISKNNTTISEVIKRAGGLTDKASLKFAEILRNYNTVSALKKKVLLENDEGIQLTLEQEDQLLKFKQNELLKMYRTADITYDDTLFFNIDNALRNLEGYSKIDLTKLSDPNSFESKYIMHENDVIIIPEIRNEVYVWGGVANSGYCQFEEGKSIIDYIKNAGGYSEIAMGDDELYLIKGKSREWINVLENEKDKIEAGDFIYIKKNRPVENFWYYVGRISAIAGILGGVATIFLAFSK